MKKKSASQSSFFNLRVLIGLFAVLAGVFLALIGFGTFSGLTANSAQAQLKHKIINVPGLPPGFDCATIYEKGINKMEGLRAGYIMIACGEATGGSASPDGAFSRLGQNFQDTLAYGRRAYIMIACGEATGGSASPDGAFSRLAKTLQAPLAYGGADFDLINPQT